MSDQPDPASLTPETWARVAELFDQVLDVPAAQRDTWLAQACDGDATLRAEIEALLAADMAPATLLDRSAAAGAETLVEHVEAGELREEEQRWMGRHIGPYQVTGILGRGGMGTVLLAERADGQFEERVALKVLRGGMASDKILRRFRQERQILAHLRHPSIAGLLHGGVTDDGQPYFAMEHVDGRPITTYCDALGLDVEARLKLMTQVIDGVQHAHRNLVVHRDLKPSNILVTGDGAVRLLDFGIAKLLDPHTGGSATRAETHMLTPQYAAPEQLSGEPVTTATDVYALGILLYELLTGELPFTGSLLGPLHGGEPEAPSRRVRATGSARCGLDATALSRRIGDLDAVVLKALRPEPEHRYPTPEALAEDLRRYLDGRPVRSRRATLSYRTGKFARRHRASVGLAMLVILALLGGLAGTAWQASAARRASARAEQEAEVARQVADFLATTFTRADQAEYGGADTTARALLDAAAERIGEELAEAPEIQARLLGILGMTYRRLSLYEESRPLLERALELRRELPESDPRALAESLFRLAKLETDLGRYTAAEPLFNEALALRRADPENRGDIAVSLHGLASLFLKTDRKDQAARLLEEALVIAEPAFGAQHRQTLAILSNLALYHLDQNRLDIAEPLARDLLERQRAVHGDIHPTVATTLHNLAVAEMRNDRPAAAEASFRQVLDIERRLYDEDQPATAGTLGFLGHALRKQGQLAAAEEAYREALQVLRRKLPPEHPYVASALKNLGWVLVDRGQPAAAEPLLRESLATHRVTRGEDHWRTQEVLMLLGRAVLASGRVGEAEPLLREAHAGLREKKGKDHPVTLQARAALEELEVALFAKP